MIRNGMWKGRPTNFHERRILVKLTASVSPDAALRAFEPTEVAEIRSLYEPGRIFVVELDREKPADPVEVCTQLAGLPGVVWAEPDFASRVPDVGSRGDSQSAGDNESRADRGPMNNDEAPTGPRFSNDPGATEQWHLNAVGLPLAWRLPNGTGTDSVRIAVLDSGIPLDAHGQLSHPDLRAPRITVGRNYAGQESINDTIGHGTLVTGIVGATSNNATGVTGVNWNSPLYIGNIVDSAGHLTDSVLISAISDVVTTAHTQGVRNLVINLSIGSEDESLALHDLCVNIDAQNRASSTNQVILCTTAGNQGRPLPESPGLWSKDLPGTIVCVGSSTRGDVPATHSNYGEGLTVLAPGEAIFSTTKDGGYGAGSGTSVATPIVSGILSLIWSVNPSLRAAQIIEILKSVALRYTNEASGQPDLHWGYGRVTALLDGAYYARRLQIDPGTAGGLDANLSINIYN